MSEQEMMTKIKELEEQNRKLEEEKKELKKLMSSKITTGKMSPYQIIASTISSKVYEEVKEKTTINTKQALKRKIMDDLKWDLHVRYSNDFKEEHIEPAKQYIENYKIDEFYKTEEE